MAFAGVPNIKTLGHYLVRITGVHLDGVQTGIIGLHDDVGADIRLPESFPHDPDPDASAHNLNMTDLIEVRVHDTSIGGGVNIHYHQNQTLNPFRIAIVNDGAQATPDLDIYIQYLHSMLR